MIKFVALGSNKAVRTLTRVRRGSQVNAGGTVGTGHRGALVDNGLALNTLNARRTGASVSIGEIDTRPGIQAWRGLALVDCVAACTSGEPKRTWPAKECIKV